MGNIPPNRLQLPIQLLGIIKINRQRLRRLHRLHLQIDKKIIRQMLRPYRLFLGHGQRHLHHAADLTQVSRPRMALEQLQYLAAQSGPLAWLAMLFPQAFEQRLFIAALS
ncbi:hypothetical protein D9M71_645530 [compost metagenome]